MCIGKASYIYQKLVNMSTENSNHNYFDESTDILAPVIIVGLLLVIFLTLFLG